MNRDEYLRMHEVEDRMWWYRGLHANLLIAFAWAGRAPPGLPLLDAGCGTGGFLARLARELPDATRLGLDFERVAAGLAAEKSGAGLCVARVDALPFGSGTLAAIFSADVLCHRSVAEGQALDGFHRCLAPGGVLVLNLPAYGWMMSAHDQAVHTARRYTRQRLQALLAGSGFSRIRTSYWNTLPFPLMVLRRKLLATKGESSDVMPFPAPVEWLFRAAMRLEGLWLKRGWALPLGGSVLAVAVK